MKHSAQKTPCLIILMLFSFFCFCSMAQTVTPEKNAEKVVIKTFSGREFVGSIISDDGKEVKIMTESVGLILLRKEEISSIKKAESENIIDGTYDDGGPFTTRYIITNNALPLKKSQNYAIWNWYGPEVHFAVSPKVNLGVMTTWGITPLIGVAKYTFYEEPQSGFYMSLGTMMGTGTYAFKKGFGGLHWLSMTWGNRRNNITFSGGYGYMRFNNELYDEGVYTSGYPTLSQKSNFMKGPMLSMSGVARLSKKVSFVIDNMYVLSSRLVSQVTSTNQTPNGNPVTVVTNNSVQSNILMIMPGMRFQKDEDRSFQAAVAINYVNDRTFPLPMLSWLRKF